jgi:hypothetical protein
MIEVVKRHRVRTATQQPASWAVLQCGTRARGRAHAHHRERLCWPW